jgi:hypothetical protein
MLKRAKFLVVGLTLMAASQAIAAVKTEMVLDAGGGITATIDVDDLGFVTCSGTCSGLSTSYDLSGVSAHGTLTVTGTIGVFFINQATGVGGLDEFALGRQDVNTLDSTSSAAGTLTVTFTDTDFCLTGGGGCFGNQFLLTASTNSSTTLGSTASFAGFVSGANTIPAGTLIGAFSNLSNASTGAVAFANPNGTGGSLTSITQINFNSAGQMNTGFEIATTAPVPETATISMLGLVLSVTMLKLRQKFVA